ncbi:MAG: hypothetical protein NVSMB2_03720 [Chloroflexota bacterium]
MLGVATDALDHARRQRVLQVQADKVKARLVSDHAADMLRLVVPEHRQVDPVEARLEARRPDHVRRIEGPSVLE